MKAVVLVLVACGRPLPPLPPPEQPWESPLGSTHATAPGARSPDTEPPRLTAPPPQLAELTIAVRALDAERLDPGALSRALAALRDALPIVAIPDDNARARLDRAIENLAEPPGAALLTNDLRTGLEIGVSVMAAGQPRATADVERYTAAVRDLAEAIEQIDREQPLANLGRVTIAAFEAATRALYVALGLPSPFELTAGSR
jgi:hypothetical protein